MHIPRGRRLCVNKKTLFCLCLFMFVFLFALWCLELCLVSLFCCSHCIMFMYVLDMHTSLCYCASLNVCSDDHLFCYMIIVAISIWLFWCMIKLLTCFTSCLLYHNLPATLYLSFYYLHNLEGLMYFVQVFQVTGIYVPSSSQFLWFMIGGEREKELCVILTMFLLCS